MKLAFYNATQMNAMLNEIYEAKTTGNQYKVGFSEGKDADVVLVLNANGEEIDQIDFDQALNEIGNHLGFFVKSYDVTELGGYGEGYALFF